MPIISRRHLRELQDQRAELAETKTKLADAEERHDLELRQLGRTIAEMQDRIDEIEAHRDNLRAQLEVAHQELADAKREEA